MHQSLVDLLAPHGIKKPAIQKALDSLESSGSVIGKAFGNTKIYIPAQSNLSVFSKEEMDAKKMRIAQAKEKLQSEQRRLKEMEIELAKWKQTKTEEDLCQHVVDSRLKLESMETRLKSLKTGSILVPKEKRDGAVKSLSKALDAWRRRRSMFRSIWSEIGEGIETPDVEVFEEAGVESDQAVGADLRKVEEMLASIQGGGSKGIKRPLARGPCPIGQQQQQQQQGNRV
jgi:26S proteasome regulatory subunit (ATPase 3-interacting protein)